MKVKDILFLLGGSFQIHITDGKDWLDLDETTSIAKIRDFWDKDVIGVNASGGVCHVYAE